MDVIKNKKSALIGYPLGLLIWIGAYVIGNVIGRIIASMNGWDDFSYDRPGGVFYAGIQAGVGSYIAVIGAKSWLGDARFVRFWLLIFVCISSAMIVLGGIAAIVLGRTEIFGWGLLSTVVGIIVIEVVRRVPDSELS